MILDDAFFNNLSILGAATIPIILAIVQALKLAGWVQDKYAPFVSIILGIGVAMLLNNAVETIGANILTGIMLGLSASGLYSGIKTTQVAIMEKRAIEKKNLYNNPKK